jgi:hypothetical protein
VIFLPMATAEVIMGASLLALFLSIGWRPGFWPIVVAHIMFSLSFVVVTVKARIASLDPRLEQAAMDLYANEWQTFRRITLPLVMPGIAGAALLAFSLSFDDFIVTNFTRGSETTFPVQVYVSALRGVPPQANVIGTAMFIACGAHRPDSPGSRQEKPVTTRITHWIDGAPWSGEPSGHADVTDPATGAVTGHVDLGGTVEVDAAVAAAAAAAKQWRNASLSKRTAVLFAFRELLNTRRGEVAAPSRPSTARCSPTPTARSSAASRSSSSPAASRSCSRAGSARTSRPASTRTPCASRSASSR